MSASRSPQELHDQSTRGDPLSPDERAILDAWYARMDSEDEATLAPASASDNGALQAQVNATINRLSAEAARIQRLSAENEALRAEIAGLRRQLAARLAAHPA